jgi:hypothetical protein
VSMTSGHGFLCGQMKLLFRAGMKTCLCGRGFLNSLAY